MKATPAPTPAPDRAPDPAPDKDTPLPYKEITDETYALQAAKNFAVTEPARGTLILRGPCPRCRAVIEIPVVSSVFRSSRSIGGRLRPTSVLAA